MRSVFYSFLLLSSKHVFPFLFFFRRPQPEKGNLRISSSGRLYEKADWVPVLSDSALRLLAALTLVGHSSD